MNPHFIDQETEAQRHESHSSESAERGGGSAGSPGCPPATPAVGGGKQLPTPAQRKQLATPKCG